MAAFDKALDKVIQASLLVVTLKVASAWVIAAVANIEMQSRLVWGFIPFAGLQTTSTQFRNVAAWSTLSVVAGALVWTAWHFARRRNHHPVWAWAAASALPMAAMLTLFEWMRRFDADRLLPSGLLVRVLLVLTAAMVLFVGFTKPPETSHTGKASTEALRRENAAS